MASPTKQSTVQQLSFRDYAAIPHTNRFSSESFRALTFVSVNDFHLPSLAPEGSLRKWVHVRDVPDDLNIYEDDVIPNFMDLLPIVAKMEEEYKAGCRGVALCVRWKGRDVNFVAHYAKIRIFQNINNNENAVEGAKDLIAALRRIKSFPANTLDLFASHSIFAPIAGFKVTSFPLWELSYLLDENWVHEDTVNALSELVYFQNCVLSKNTPSKFLFLPTSFYAHALLLYTGGHSFSPIIHAIRRRVVATNVDAIGFLILERNHFTAVWVDRSGIFFADSLDTGTNGGPGDLAPMLSWVFQATPFQIANEVTKVDVPQQTHGDGSGSCGIAAHNFIHRHTFDNVAKWTAARSTHFRDGAMVDLVIYHMGASERHDGFDDWVKECVSPEGRDFTGDDHEFHAYEDYNLFSPNDNHPIYTYLTNQDPFIFDREIDVTNSTTGYYYVATPRRDEEKIDRFVYVTGGMSSPSKHLSTGKPEPASPQEFEVRPIKSKQDVPVAFEARPSKLHSAFKTPTRRSIPAKTNSIKSEPPRITVHNVDKALHEPPLTEQKARPFADGACREFLSRETLRVVETSPIKREVSDSHTPKMNKEIRSVHTARTFLLPPLSNNPFEDGLPSIVRREVTPAARPGIIDLTTSLPAGVPRRPTSVIDLTNSSPFIKRESNTPILHPYMYRSQSVIEISSDSEDTVREESCDTLDSDDPGKFWIQDPTSLTRRRESKKVIRSNLPAVDEDQTPHPPRLSLGQKKHAIASSPTPHQGRPRVEIDARGGGTDSNPVTVKQEGDRSGKVQDVENNNATHPRVFVPPPRAPPRLDGPAHSLQVKATLFPDVQTARDAVYAQEERRGFQWKVRKTDLDPQKEQKKVVLMCRRQGAHVPVHAPDIDPSQFRDGKSVRVGCEARVNLSRTLGGWHITRYDEEHNHDREIPVGGTVRRPPTREQKEAIAQLDAKANLNRRQLAAILSIQESNHGLEDRQISNLLNAVRRERRGEVNAFGGDFEAVLAFLQEANERGEMWFFRIKLDTNGVLRAIFWQSAAQRQLAIRNHDLMVNDNAQNRNQYQFALNVGICVDNLGKSRNTFYGLQATEDTALHVFMLQSYLESVGRAPEIIFTDKDAALAAAIAQVFPQARHLTCLHHMLGNIVDNIRPGTKGQAGWEAFLRLFWAAYRAVSPDEFERLWGILVTEFPGCRAYLQEELYPTRRQWAWAWIGKEFTAGIRTNGRAESENRINKLLGGPKKTVFELFKALNARTVEQAKNEAIQVRQTTRQKHPQDIESVFLGPLQMLRAYAGPYALQTCYRQMELSMYYTCDVMPKPQGREGESWNATMIQRENEPGFEWDADGNVASEDHPYLALAYLISELAVRRLTIMHILIIRHIASGAVHHLLTLADGRPVCDCGMPMNLGLPCRHIFRALQALRELPFHISLVRARWYIDPNLDVNQIPPILLNSTVPNRNRDNIVLNDLPAVLRNNPFASVVMGTNIPPGLIGQGASRNSQAPPPTQTISSREVFHEVQAAIRPMLSTVQTADQLSNLIDSLHTTRREQEKFASEGRILDPLPICHKGKPRTARITAGREGPPRGGGGGRCLRPRPRKSAYVQQDDSSPEEPDESEDDAASPPRKRVRTYKCSICHEQGHNRQNCPTLQNR